ncbi:MAG: hypothetical protein K9L32_14390, partial [Chromatiaceae bacterium]|nr:hypothetical protein [Chromatiaceae bacterium]
SDVAAHDKPHQGKACGKLQTAGDRFDHGRAMGPFREPVPACWIACITRSMTSRQAQGESLFLVTAAAQSR